VTALAVMRLVDLGSTGEIVGGQMLFRPSNPGPGEPAELDLAAASEAEIRRIRGNHISMIFQEPLTSLNPVYTTGDQVTEAIRLHQGLDRKGALVRAKELFDLVRIPEASRRLKQYPHEMSGGMRQRVMIAMALSCDPSVLIADEPTTALDVTIQSQILSLIAELRRETGAAVIMITHDMGVVAEVADEVVVMNRSKVVETGTVYEIFENPTQQYTRSLLAAVPRLGSMTGSAAPARFDLVGAADGAAS